MTIRVNIPVHILARISIYPGFGSVCTVQTDQFMTWKCRECYRQLLMLLNYSRAYLHHFDHSLYIPPSHTPRLVSYVQWLHVIGQTTVIFNHYLRLVWKQKKTKRSRYLTFISIPYSAPYVTYVTCGHCHPGAHISKIKIKRSLKITYIHLIHKYQVTKIVENENKNLTSKSASQINNDIPPETLQQKSIFRSKPTII